MLLSRKFKLWIVEKMGYGIQSTESHHKMKYNINSRIPKYWDQSYLQKLTKNIKYTVLDKILGIRENYTIGKHNLLKDTTFWKTLETYIIISSHIDNIHLIYFSKYLTC